MVMCYKLSALSCLPVKTWDLCPANRTHSVSKVSVYFWQSTIYIYIYRERERDLRKS